MTVQLAGVPGADDDDAKWTLVLLGEGFTEAEQPAFNAAASGFVAGLQTVAPFDEPEVWARINIHRAIAISNDTGVPELEVGEPRPEHDTAFGLVHRVGGIAGGGSTDWDKKLQHQVALQARSGCDASMLIVNSVAGFGTAVAGRDAVYAPLDLAALEDELVTFLAETPPPREGTVAPWFDRVANVLEAGVATILHRDHAGFHELGHLFGLADEYDGNAGWARRAGQFLFSHPPNISYRAGALFDIKWQEHVDRPARSPSILQNHRAHEEGCEVRGVDRGFIEPSDLEVFGVTDDHVALFEGAQQRNCGRWRPQFDCLMNAARLSRTYPPRAANNRFCTVCRQAIREFLIAHTAPDPWWSWRPW